MRPIRWSDSRFPIPEASPHIQHERYGGRERAPCVGLALELIPPASRELVVLRTPVVVRRTPFGADPPASLESMQCGVERALGDLEHRLRDIAKALGDRPSVHGA